MDERLLMPETATDRLHRMLGRLLCENLIKDEQIETLRAELQAARTPVVEREER